MLFDYLEFEHFVRCFSSLSEIIRISTIFFKWFLIHSPLYSLIMHSGDSMHKKYLITRGVIRKKGYYSALWKLSSTKALKKGGRTMTKIVHSAFLLKFSKQVWCQPSFYDIKVIKLHFLYWRYIWWWSTDWYN